MEQIERISEKDRLLKFIKDKKINDKTEKKLLSMFDDGNLKSVKNVNYDNVNGEILSLNCLSYNADGDFIIADAKNIKKNCKN